MKHYCRLFILVMSFVTLLGCQSTPTPAFFNFASSDSSINNAVNEALMMEPTLSHYRFHVETKEGTVYLSGYVKTIKQSDTALDVAKKVPGVKAVENNIIVRK